MMDKEEVLIPDEEHANQLKEKPMAETLTIDEAMDEINDVLNIGDVVFKDTVEDAVASFATYEAIIRDNFEVINKEEHWDAPIDFIDELSGEPMKLNAKLVFRTPFAYGKNDTRIASFECIDIHVDGRNQHYSNYLMASNPSVSAF